MATTVAKLEAILSADTGRFDSAMDRSHKKMSMVGKVAGVAGLAIAAGLGLAAKAGFKELMEGEKVAAQTNAVLTSTGGIANVTSKQIDKLSSSMLRKTGIDDEAIKSGANMLLTFTNVRNEAGRGNDVFNQSTKILADMSTALGTDMSKSAIQLGKALNDPIKGVGALARVGVTFTKEQKKVIAELVKSGDVMGAQKIILAELNKEFGGSAEAVGKTLPGQINIAKESFKNLTAELMSSLMPAFNMLVAVVIKATSWMSDHQKATKILVGGMAALAAVLLTVSAATKVVIAAQAIAKAATVAWTAVQWLLNAALTANPIGIVVVAIAALVAGLVLAYKRSETFRAIVQGAFDAVKTAATAVLNFFRNNWPLIAILISGPFAPLVALATNAFGIRSALTGAFNSLLGAVRATVGSVVAVVAGLPARILGALGDVGGLLYGAGRAIIGGLISGLTSRLGEVANLVSSIAGKIKSLKGPIEYDRKLLVPEGRAIIEGLQYGMESSMKGMLGSVSGFAPTIQGSFASPSGGSGGGNVIVTVNGDVTGTELVNKVRDALIQINRRTGGNALGGFA